MDGRVKTSFHSRNPDELLKVNGPPLYREPFGVKTLRPNPGLNIPVRVELEKAMLMGFPAVPVNVILAFCPGVVIVIGIEEPPSVPEAVASAGILKSLMRDCPVTLPLGFMNTVYVPVAGKTVASIYKEPIEPLAVAI